MALPPYLDDGSSSGLNPQQIPSISVGQSPAEADTTETPTAGEDIFDSDVPSLLSEEHQANAWTDYRIDIMYVTPQGNVQLPLASEDEFDDATCAVVQLHAQLTEKIVKWTAERQGEKPILPFWDTDNDNEVLLERRIQTCSLVVMPNGATPVWRASGTYRYALYKYSGEDDRLYLGAIPVMSLSADTIYYDGNDYSADILKVTATGATAPLPTPPWQQATLGSSSGA